MEPIREPQAAATKPTSSGPDPAFGAVLLEQKIRAGNIGNAIFLMLLGLPMTLVVLAPAAPLEIRIGFFLFGAALATFAGVMLWRHLLHVYLQESGIREYRQWRGRSLAYDQVDEMLYSSLRLFMHGGYIHTIQKLTLKANPMPGPHLVCTHIFKEADSDAPAEAATPVVAVRDSVSRLLMQRLAQPLAREGAVDWTAEVRSLRPRIGNRRPPRRLGNYRVATDRENGNRSRGLPALGRCRN